MTTKTFLSSNTLGEHVLRGVIGISLLWYALRIADQHPWLSFACGVIILIAFAATQYAGQWA